MIEDKYIEDISYYAEFFKMNVIINVIKFRSGLGNIIKTFINNKIIITNSKDLKILFSSDKFYQNMTKEKGKEKNPGSLDFNSFYGSFNAFPSYFTISYDQASIITKTTTSLIDNDDININEH